MAKITELVFTDIETTGVTFKPGLVQEFTDQIIEVAAARVNIFTRKIVDRFTTVIQPEQYHPQVVAGEPPSWMFGPFHKKSNRFDGVDWMSGLPLKEALSILAERFFIDGATLAGQNPTFDLGHFRRDFEAADMKLPALDYHLVDSGSLAILPYVLGETEGLSLKNTRGWAGVEEGAGQTHRAMDDVLDTIQVFFAMVDRFRK